VCSSDLLAEPKWSALFAVFALGLIEKGCDDEQYYEATPASDNWIRDWRICHHVNYWLIEAMEAITLAEAFEREECLQQTVDEANTYKEQVTNQYSQAALARHRETAEAAQALYDFFRQGDCQSMADAARRFCETYPNLVEHLAPTNRVRTLTERLSKLIKQRPISEK
jgi:hypothetical protein